jgi:anti-sigma28 factor (negative regulator of flagellin synthesis)
MVATNDRIQHITADRRDRITRASRVRMLARQVADGEYVVDADKVAEALVRRARFHHGVQVDLLSQHSPAL